MTDLPGLNDCGCCAGTHAETPVGIDNAPGLSAISYRVGRHSSFKESILAGLSGRTVPALAGLGARTDDDMTVAIGDGFAVMADVLTFYQERIANEAYLRTATERRSVLEQARLLGYQLDPGVAADAWLAFTLEEARGTRPPPTVPVTIAERTKVQSVPGPDEAPQTFETVAPIEARVERNAIAVQTSEPQTTFFGQRQLILAGTGHQLAPGDIILVVGRERRDYHGSENWDIRLLRAVEPDEGRDITRISWLEGLGSESPHVEPAVREVNVYVFRQRASIFGHNAPNPLLLAQGPQLDKLANADGTWKNFALSGTSIDLDQAYQRIVPGGWVALVSDAIKHTQVSSLPGYAELYGIVTVAFPSVEAFGLASKTTRLGLDTGEHLDWYSRRETLVLAGTENLPLADRPIRSPLYGDRIALAEITPDLFKGQAIAVSGARQHLRVARSAGKLSLELEDGTLSPLAPGDRVALLAPPTRDAGPDGRLPLDPDELTVAIDEDQATDLEWHLEDRDGHTGSLQAGAVVFELDAATKDDASFAEVVLIAASADAIVSDRDRTTIRLATSLTRAYDRDTVRVNANVAPATHGETVSEILGSGDSSRRDQRMPLKQAPLTFVGADTPSGRVSTLEVRVDDTLWTERPSLYQAGARDRVHAVRIADDGTAMVHFGDGAEGARPPTGQANIRARYRKGIGAAGNVRAGQLTTLLTRPLGVTAVSNPEPATGGEDPEPLDSARQSAPLTVLTLDRAVSRRDYEDFARGFAGIDKAHAAWIPTGRARGVVITVAGPGGADIKEGGKTHLRLVDSLRKSADALLPVAIRSYKRAAFVLGADVKVDALEEVEPVLASVRSTLIAAFDFKARSFGQPVSIDEVVAVVHRVKGVVAVDVNVLRRTDQGSDPAVRPRLSAELPTVVGGTIKAAELLTIDPSRLVIGLMT